MGMKLLWVFAVSYLVYVNADSGESTSAAVESTTEEDFSTTPEASVAETDATTSPPSNRCYWSFQCLRDEVCENQKCVKSPIGTPCTKNEDCKLGTVCDSEGHCSRWTPRPDDDDTDPDDDDSEPEDDDDDSDSDPEDDDDDDSEPEDDDEDDEDDF